MTLTPLCSVFIFDHELLHEGDEVKEGVKYVIRTDLMFAFG